MQAGGWNTVDVHDTRGVHHGQAEMDEGNQARDLQLPRECAHPVL